MGIIGGPMAMANRGGEAGGPVHGRPSGVTEAPPPQPALDPLAAWYSHHVVGGMGAAGPSGIPAGSLANNLGYIQSGGGWYGMAQRTMTSNMARMAGMSGWQPTPGEGGSGNPAPYDRGLFSNNRGSALPEAGPDADNGLNGNSAPTRQLPPSGWKPPTRSLRQGSATENSGGAPRKFSVPANRRSGQETRSERPPGFQTAGSDVVSQPGCTQHSEPVVRPSGYGNMAAEGRHKRGRGEAAERDLEGLARQMMCRIETAELSQQGSGSMPAKRQRTAM